MEVIICPDGAEVARLGAGYIARARLECGPEIVLGVATGSSPLAMYQELTRMVRSGELDLSRASAFALDEYVGLAPGHPQSYAEVIRRTVTEPLGLDSERVHVPDGSASDVEGAARDYEASIARAGGIDVQILGIGSNGHIGFNEPTSSLTSRTRIKTLTERTRRDNARFFSGTDEVPTHCLTQGLGTIMDAGRLLLLAQGEHKAAAVAAAVEGPITAMVPGSILQFHRFATVIVDEAAASELRLADYYRFTFERKPEWQRYDVPTAGGR